MPSDEIISAIRELVDYSWSDEAQDYEINPTPTHIFLHLETLDNWLKRIGA